MTRKERNGKRKSRRINSKIPSLGYYLIVTDTNATERNYFIGLRNALPEGMRNKLIIHVEKAKKTDQLIKKCVELFSNDPQYRIPWIVFDRDQVTRFDNIIVDAKKRGIHVGWSNPCFEVWMYGYKSRRKTHRLVCGMKAAFLCETTFLLLDIYIDFII